MCLNNRFLKEICLNIIFTVPPSVIVGLSWSPFRSGLRLPILYSDFMFNKKFHEPTDSLGMSNSFDQHSLPYLCAFSKKQLAKLFSLYFQDRTFMLFRHENHPTLFIKIALIISTLPLSLLWRTNARLVVLIVLFLEKICFLV